ncbi:MAG: TldD/PmbA family protein [Proteobacteria bacterium]|nr:TldD/PmbA family protein [Pseudomonadota bacterium]
MSVQMKTVLKHLVAKQQGYVELRWHRRLSHQFVATKGRVDVANQGVTEGVGVRALVDGAWGFAATADVSEPAIKRAIEQAQLNARLIASIRGQRPNTLGIGKLSTKDFIGAGFKELVELSVADKLGQVISMEQELAKSSKLMHTAKVRYSEYLEEKAIVTSDGACCSMQIAQPELSVSAIAEKDGQRSTSHKGAGVSGGWNCLFKHPTLDHVIDDVSKTAVDLLAAKYPEGGKKICILAPAVVGLLCHEAIGHTVEADFVKSGSVAQGKIGQQVASKLVTMADSGCESIAGYAVGNLPFDDEGIETENTVIIKDGILNSYLHNRETAAEFGVTPTGNSRAWMFSDEPLIRMRNTYIVPGKQKLSDMIMGLEDGYLIEGAGSGQADANGEFMFGSSYVWEIKNGKKTNLLREATLSGIAFDVLKTVDAVSEEFLWDLGTGHCGKGQPAKVDAGGPYIRCEIDIGGRQS